MRRKGAHERADVSHIRAEFDRVWCAQPFGEGAPFPDFLSWCSARTSLVDVMERQGLSVEDFEEVV